MAPQRKQCRQELHNPLIGARICVPTSKFGEEWAREAHGEAWNDMWYDGILLCIVRLRTREHGAIVRCQASGTFAKEWLVTKETVRRYMPVDARPGEGP